MYFSHSYNGAEGAGTFRPTSFTHPLKRACNAKNGAKPSSFALGARRKGKSEATALLTLKAHGFTQHGV